jgi:hypothetical protein
LTVRRPLIDMPARCYRLPIDKRGYPVPKFVEYVDGEPDFRVMNPRHMRDCINKKVCWICGEKLGVHLAFTIGPMCAINKVTSEPPTHKECAIFALKNCPFLSNPAVQRRERAMPEGHKPPAGIMIQHNPGASCLWITKTYKPFAVEHGAMGILFQLGPPESVTWWARGREATRAEIEASIDKGFPKLLAACQLDDDPEDSLRVLWQMRSEMEKHLPL